MPRFAGHGERWWRYYFAEFRSYRNQSKKRVKALEQFLLKNNLIFKSLRGALENEVNYSNHQYREAGKMLEALTLHAGLNGVPIEWRRIKN